MSTKKRNIAILLVICFIFSTELATTYLFIEHNHSHHHNKIDINCEICYNVQKALSISRNIFTAQIAIVSIVFSFLLVKKLINTSDVFLSFENLVSLKVKLSN